MKTFSQENRFIEISAIDTIQLKPLRFYYEISVQNNYSFNSSMISSNMTKISGDTGNDNSFKRKKAAGAYAKQIMDLLEANKYSYKLDEESNYTINAFNRSSDSTILVTLSSEAELKNLYHLLLPLQNISSHISRIEYESAAPYWAGLYSRLFLKAKMEASTIASFSGSSIGQLISIEEERNLFTDIVDEIKNSEAGAALLALNKGKNNLDKKVFKKILFKFQLK
jgi:hypothetical protein